MFLTLFDTNAKKSIDYRKPPSYLQWASLSPHFMQVFEALHENHPIP